MLGGREAIATALESRGKDGLMRLSYRPDDPSAGLIIGEPQPSSCLVMRISRKQGDEQTTPQVTIMGKVSRHYKFNSLADYQYLPIDSLVPNPSNGSDPSSEVSGRPEGCLLIPPIFARPETMQDYHFKPAKAPAPQLPRLPSPPPIAQPPAVDPPAKSGSGPMEMEIGLGDDDDAYDILED